MRGELDDRVDYAPRVTMTRDRYNPYCDSIMPSGSLPGSQASGNAKRGFDVSPDSVQLAKQWLTGKL